MDRAGYIDTFEKTIKFNNNDCAHEASTRATDTHTHTHTKAELVEDIIVLLPAKFVLVMRQLGANSSRNIYLFFKKGEMQKHIVIRIAYKTFPVFFFL